jgi:hypothetical protein
MRRRAHRHRPSYGEYLPTRPGEPCGACGACHQSWYTLARCVFDERLCIWISGNPPLSGPCWALVSDCRAPYMDAFRTVTLWASEARALQEKAVIDRTHCGHCCVKRHRVVALHVEPD